MTSTSLLWFRRDLRVRDLPPLTEAAAAAEEVLACFVLDSSLTSSSGRARLQFLGDALRALNDSIGGRLLVVRGKPEVQVPRIAEVVGATSVHISADVSPYGRARDERVASALGDIELHSAGSPYAVTPGRVTKDDGQPYKVYTPFFRAWREHGWHSPARTDATTARWMDPAPLTVDDGPLHAASIPDPGITLQYPASEAGALDRWNEFLDDSLVGVSDHKAYGVTEYNDIRDRPDIDATSRMSAHLKFGTIHPRTMLADLTAPSRKHSDGAYSYIRELCFRDFYAAVLYHWPESSWGNWNSAFNDIAIDGGDGAQHAFSAWKEGCTGFPVVDAGMRQLAATGWMHNRLRMIVASFLVKDLHLPWQWGARWFMEQLVDGDLASNNHGWQWAAGSGTDASPYFRVFNPTTQGEKFDPSGDYVRRWVPELAEISGKAVHALKDGRPSSYPPAMVDHKAEREEALRRFQEIKR